MEGWGRRLEGPFLKDHSSPWSNMFRRPCDILHRLCSGKILNFHNCKVVSTPLSCFVSVCNGQVISKGLVGILNSSRKNEKIRPSVLWQIRSNVFIRFLGELKTLKSPFEINWPLATTRAIMCRDKFQSVSYMKSSISSKLLTTLRKNIAIVCQFLEKNMSTLYIKHSLTPNMFNSIKLPT